MLYPFVPKRSGLHRIAGIALFRALLRKCRELPIENAAKESIANAIRHRFKRNRHVCSKRFLSAAFRGGYEGLDLLEASKAGDASSTSRILDLLARLPERIKQPPLIGPLLPKEPLATKSEPPKKPRSPILSRPFPSVSGKRRAPHLVLGTGFSFLRIQKPQPAGLTGYIVHRRKKTQKRHDILQSLTDTALPIARWEDVWDDILTLRFDDINDHGVDDEANVPAWSDAVKHQGISHLSNLLDSDNKKYNVRARALWEIVKKERELVTLEREERKLNKRQEWLAKRAASATADNEVQKASNPTQRSPQ